jgi:pyruvate,water dikinase
VRSSATAEDLPTASFAGQQETYLNVHDDEELLRACQKCFASLFTDRAIIYRIEKGFDHFKVALSIGVQKMIRSDLACSGVMFTLDPETGFKDVVTINASYGLGESIVQGLVTPDEYVVHKPTFQAGFKSIIKKYVGAKQAKMIYTDSAELIKTVPVSSQQQHEFVLTDDEILELAQFSLIIEREYSALKKSWTPMDIEWAKDGIDGKLYIIQARPETVQARKDNNVLLQYRLKDLAHNAKPLVTGQSIGQKIATGAVRVIHNVTEIAQLQEGEILVTQMTDPDWVPAMRKAAGIITDHGGRTCHAAIVSRELGLAALVGAGNATELLQNEENVTLDCSRGAIGAVYKGILPFTTTKIKLSTLPKPCVPYMVNIADPDSAFECSFLPVAGVGLARVEFIISNTIKIHPMALIHPDKITDAATQKKIDELTEGYTDKKSFFVDSLSQGIGMIAAGFYPRPVIVRFSDFKTNEYRNLIGGIYFEPEEENPMLGFRGASRYYNERYKDAFALECAALKKARDVMGLTNIIIMVPFVRTTQEAQAVMREMKVHGLVRGKNNLKVYMMCELPANVVLMQKFSKYFDGFSIGSNDLTQFTLGVDRDSQMLADLFDERDEAVKEMLKLAIAGARKNKKSIGICGQAPSDYPELLPFLINCGISSISLNADSVIQALKKSVRFCKKSFFTRIRNYFFRRRVN